MSIRVVAKIGALACAGTVLALGVQHPGRYVRRPAPKSEVDAVQRAVPFLMSEGTKWIDEKKCISCHMVPFMLWSLTEAEAAGAKVPDGEFRARTQWSLDDAHYGDQRRLAMDLAAVLNVEIGRLAAAGCRWIQVDEPVFARKPVPALDYGVEALARCFHDVPAGVTRTVHICCGYPAGVDDDTYPKADRGAYFTLADALEAAPVDAISLEDAHRHNDLTLLERFAASTVLLGVVGIARTRVEPVDEIRARLMAALDHIDADRLIAAPDCGLIMLDRATARAKLEHLAAAAKSVGG